MTVMPPSMGSEPAREAISREARRVDGSCTSGARPRMADGIERRSSDSLLRAGRYRSGQADTQVCQPICVIADESVSIQPIEV
jgi:hypothetical protein